jgi:hypothetical protein
VIWVALMLAQASPATPPAAPEEDVTIIGKRLASWVGKVSTTFGITTCRTTRSTGDAAIDAVGCTALKRRWSEYRPQIAAARRNAGTAGEVSPAERALGQCLKSTRDELVDQLATQRRGDPR